MTRWMAVTIMLLGVVFGGCSRSGRGPEERPNTRDSRTFYVVEVLDGKAARDRFTFSKSPAAPREIRIDAVSPWEHAPEPRNRESIQMILAFQLADGKTRADFEAFKAIDAPWVASNNGSNPATYWTARAEGWPFDAFEDVTFASQEDFQRAYAGNDELARAAEGLFGPEVFVAVVVE